MRPSDFFTWAEFPEPFGTRSVFDADLVDSFRLRPRSDISDLEAAYGLTQLARDELVAFGTDGRKQLDNEDISVVLRTLRAIHRRLGIDFDPPFRDFAGFHGYWSAHDMSGPGGWGARRGYLSEEGNDQPALLPQVYLHYDPRTRRERGGQPSVLMRERLDFLLLLPHGVRIVLEADGKQHYAQGDVASPRLYSEMMSEDRRLRLRGYDVYRFGGYELSGPGVPDMLREFFGELLATYEVGP